ncbi:coumaroyl-CoA:anthocyanidin 3-O-glucoside-6''-O-coumaroyltransferase 2-like [Senna tora]|uniref:Coumaroyl-CoA:anthocyanidin 3-O-glucoside-6''-O-coumaroyltransferase 2-like n=1 Tax=Senna tora TaxID=362788 RepID=A0A834W4U6_9FABA|nr:coumaroyl-CoA:anthocyanidin 3-O-glucoside-6''-O-coumaroyltransferase 2-like [Senna tora]
MAYEARTYKLIERSQIGPAIPPHPNSTSLPLTFLDISLAGPIYVRRQFFYHFPYPIHHFIHTTLPSLKRSLSLALQHFFPLAGSLHCPPPPRKPFIHCTAPHSVPLAVLHSDSSHHHTFQHLSSNSLKSLKDLDHLVPKLSWSSILENDVVVDGVDDNLTLVFPILALQVTLFPNQGLCIAITYCHVMDDRSCSHFMKSWASICESGGDMSFLEKSPPCYDRGVVKDPKGLEAIFLRDYFEERSKWKNSEIGSVVSDHDDLYKATLVLRGKDIEGLRKWVMREWEKNEESSAPKYLSKFVVTCGFVWGSFVKTRYRDEDEEDEKDEYFTFAADCRNRVEYSIAGNYFGNCLARCHATLKRKEVKGEEGFLKGVKVIERAIQDMKKDPFEDAESWNDKFVKMFVLGSIVLVTGSPNFRVYDTDFGFGRPTKVEMVHSFKGMSLAESGHEEGGLEASQIRPADPVERNIGLTFFDISLVGPIYIKRQFFYHYPFSTHHFTHTTLPSLKHSLSLALHHFSPFAGKLLCPPPPRKPFIRYTPNDSLAFTILESHSLDFHLLSTNSPTNLADLDLLSPKLSWSTIDEGVNGVGEDDTLVLPLAALQVTVFPNQGLCIAITYSHVMDDSSCNHFMKSWASVCASGGDLTFLNKSPPSYEREMIKDPKGLEAIFLEHYFQQRATWKDRFVGKTESVVSEGDDYHKATLVLGSKDIEEMKKWAMNEWKKSEESSAPKFLSKFVVACGFVWASFVKMRYRNEEEEDKEEYFIFKADCRNRLEYSVPANYFGNCITRCDVAVKRKEVMGEEGFLKAVKAIEGAIEKMKKEPFEGAEKWDETFIKMFAFGSAVMPAGSPKFTAYDTNFGFGRPIKCEMVHSHKIMSIAESAYEEGGLEVGFNFRKGEYQDFVAVVERGLQALKS